MSGIIALYHRDQSPVDRSVLHPMLDSLLHRGPGAQEFFEDGSAGLASAISKNTVPPAAGTPISRFSSYTLVWDGRIDNREDLFTALGLTPDANLPDPDLALRAYAASGIDFLKQLHGDFSFLLWDGLKKRLVGGRDRIGIKPFYYFQNDRFFGAASEIKALLRIPGIPIEADDETILSFLSYRNFCAEDFHRTFFKGIQRLAPGHYLMVEEGRVSVHAYWEIDPSFCRTEMTYPQAVKELRSLLAKSVSARSTVSSRQALFLSGGLDSSALAGLLHEANPSSPVHAVNLYSGDPASDERIYAREVVKRAGFRYTELFSRSQDCLSRLNETLSWAEAPMVDISADREPFEFLRDRGIGSLLTGDGGDHLLDEDAFPADLMERMNLAELARTAKPYAKSAGLSLVSWLLENLACLVPQSLKNLKRRLLRNCPPAWIRRDQGAFAQVLRKTFYPAKPRFHSRVQAYSYENVISPYFVFKLEVQDHLAAQYGIEMLYPFLDARLVEWVLSLPAGLRVSSVRKKMLRDACRDILPEKVLSRCGKSGFTGEMDALLMKALEAGNPLQASGLMKHYLNHSQAAKMIQAYQTGKKDLRWEVWFLLAVDSWLQTFKGERHAAARTAAQPQKPETHLQHA